MEMFIGVDGGGTRTRALSLSEDYAFSRLSTAPGSNAAVVGVCEAAANVASAIEKSLQQAPEELSKIFIFTGIAGIRTGDDHHDFLHGLSPLLKKLKLTGVELYLGSDLEAAHAGAFDGKPGIVVVAGTGSAAFAVNARDERVQVGGWGWRMDDAGSGYWIACRALQAAARAVDGRGAQTRLGELICAQLIEEHLGSVRQRVSSEAFPREEIAALSTPVLEAAEAGDGPAREIVEEAVHELALLGSVAANRIGLSESTDACLIGGLGNSSYFRDRFGIALKKAIPAAMQILPASPPVVGSVILAAKAAGKPIEKEQLQKLSSAVSKLL